MDVRDLFPRDVRERAAREPFDRRRAGLSVRVRRDGRCVVGALLREAGHEAPATPSRGEAAAAFTGRAFALAMTGTPDQRAEWWDVWECFEGLIRLNDDGRLATVEDVRRALLPEEEAS